ncbi:hypothetical protein DRN77_01535 [Methanosarcinales archaeon]|nr:MAG: hypothetical protein DRN77_01535 [Methanosarcinales archaeon]
MTFGSGVHPSVESRWFNNTRLCKHRNNFFAAADAVVALYMTVQSANVDVEPIRQDNISGRIHDPADRDPLDAGKY